MPDPYVILLTGASGYVGGRLLARLEADGRRVRCLVRNPEDFRRPANSSAEVVAGDVLDRSSLDAALRGAGAAYYLVHSMGSTDSFEETDRDAARNFGQAARAAGVDRIIYLGGLGSDRDDLSPHLRSRHEVGAILRESGVHVLEFRASIVLGSGSISYEMISALVERLPVMITPKWVKVPAQPIAISDLLDYLAAALRIELQESLIYEIGGSERVSYAELMKVYARQKGLRRLMIPVPVLTPYLSSLWLGLITPLYARVGRKLIESIVHPTVVRDESALAAFHIRPAGVEEAMRAAIADDSQKSPRVLIDQRTLTVAVSAASAFRAIQNIGGDTGWYAWNWLWKLRGFLDALVGGVGMRRSRGRRAPLAVGDEVDFWRVEAIDPNRRVRLKAEMLLPGEAWLEFEISSSGSLSTIRQTATFQPSGILGKLYWYAVFPLHELVFRGMLKGLARAAIRDRRQE